MSGIKMYRMERSGIMRKIQKKSWVIVEKFGIDLGILCKKALVKVEMKIIDGSCNNLKDSQ